MGTMACTAWTRGRAWTAGREHVGYSLKEPWGEPRVVIGIDADEAEYLAEFLDRDECVQRGQVPLQQAQPQQAPVQSGPPQQVPVQSGPPQQVKLTEPVSEAAAEYPSPALVSAPPVPSRGRQSPALPRDIAVDLTGRTPGERPGQVPEQLSSWPPGVPPAAGQPPASA